MIVLKFGGTSVGNAKNIKSVAQIISSYNEPKIVVLSAVAGTTNALVTIFKYLLENNTEAVKKEINTLELQYHSLLDELYTSEYYQLKALTYIRNTFDYLRTLTVNNEKEILAQGEIISTHLFQFYLEEQKQESSLIDALEFMSIDEFGDPNCKSIKRKLKNILEQTDTKTIITQGYICRNHLGKIDNLKRGGSDYTASLIGAAVKAIEIQIWTDIDGMHNNDPRYVENTFSIKQISFDEAAELAYFGAKILHPQSIIPAKENNIPVLLKNTFAPNQKGTLITNCTSGNGVRAIAAKDGIIAMKIKSYRMLMAYGFLKRVFEIFEKYQTAIDMITTSEVAVSLTIDDGTYLNKITQELQEFSQVEIDNNMSIICLAGNFSQQEKGISAKVLNALKNIPLRMISYGGSNYNMSLLVTTEHKVAALSILNEKLFTKKLESEPLELI